VVISSPVPKKLEASSANDEKMEKVSYINSESSFQWDLFQDQMAWDKLHEGIRGFAKDGESHLVITCSGVLTWEKGAALKELLKEKLQA